MDRQNATEKTIFSRLRHYISVHKTDLNVPFQMLMYVYSSQAHATTKATPFILVKGGRTTDSVWTATFILRLVPKKNIIVVKVTTTC